MVGDRQTGTEQNGARRLLAVMVVPDGREKSCPGEQRQVVPAQLCLTGGPAI